ncbi:HAD family hydrolase [Streptomyces sp. NPDC001315]|uniref:HAD family hydrolase n=1 Tax=Streptomyces sp. NPDC001315 TaxID=3364562 RepID=UPI00368CBA49
MISDSASPRAPRVLLLDLDGVLLDTRPVMEQAWSEVRRVHGINIPFEAYAQHLGRPFDAIMELLGLEAVTDAIHRTYTQALANSSSAAREFDGMRETLFALAAAGWQLGVVTSKTLDRAAPLLTRLGCPFATIRASDGPGRGKPAPDPILLALVDLGADPGCATYVGDMAVDHEAARRAGVSYVHAGWGYGTPGLPTPEIAGEPKDLLRLVDAKAPAGPFVEGSVL